MPFSNTGGGYRDIITLANSDKVDAAVLVLNHALVFVHGDPASVDLIGDVHALGVDGLHLEAELCLWFILLYTQLLEEDIGAIEDGARVASGGALPAKESGQLTRLDTTLLGKAVADSAAKGGLRDVGFFQERADLLTNLVARLVDRNGLGILALEANAASVEDLANLLVNALPWACLGLLGGQSLETLQLAFLEKLESGGVGVAVHALVGAGHRHEVLVAPGRYTDVLLEFLDFHVSAVDEVADLLTNLLTALIDVVESGVIIGNIGDVFGLFELLDGVGLALSTVVGSRRGSGGGRNSSSSTGSGGGGDANGICRRDRLR